MPMTAQTFTRVGGDPDLSALATAIRPTLGDPFYLGVSGNTVTVQKPSVWTGPQITAVQAAATACPAQTDQTDAQNAVDSLRIVDKAIVLVLIDELNIVRAALPTPLGARTPAQALAAIRTKAGTL